MTLFAQDAAERELEQLEEQLEAQQRKETMMMAILQKAGLASVLDRDGDGSVSKEEGEAYLTTA